MSEGSRPRREAAKEKMEREAVLSALATIAIVVGEREEEDKRHR